MPPKKGSKASTGTTPTSTKTSAHQLRKRAASNLTGVVSSSQIDEDFDDTFIPATVSLDEIEDPDLWQMAVTQAVSPSDPVEVFQPSKKQKLAAQPAPTVSLFVHPEYRADVVAITRTTFPTPVAEVNAHKAVIGYHLRVQLWKRRDIPPKERNQTVTTIHSSAGVPKTLQSQLESQIGEHYSYIYKQLRKQFDALTKQFSESDHATQINSSISQAKVIGFRPATPLIDNVDILSRFINHDAKLIHEVWAPILDVAPPAFLTKPEGATWLAYFERCTIKILQEYIDIHYLYILSAGTGPADSDMQQAKLRTKALQSADFVKPPSDWFPLCKPDKWSLQRNKVPLFGELRYNEYSGSLTPDEFAVMTETDSKSPHAPHTLCVCNVHTQALDDTTDGLMVEVQHIKEKAKLLTQAIGTTFERLTEKRTSLANLIADTDKWMLHRTKEMVSKVDNINSHQKMEELIGQAKIDFLHILDAEQESHVLNRPMDPKLPTTIQEFKTWQLFKLTVAHLMTSGKITSLTLTPADLNVQSLPPKALSFENRSADQGHQSQQEGTPAQGDPASQNSDESVTVNNTPGVTPPADYQTLSQTMEV